MLDDLGAGSFSQVTRVVTRKGERYACKHLKSNLMSRPDVFKTAASELAYEAHLLGSFDHPHILKIRGWTYNGISSFEDGRHDSFFLLLDILDETLEQRIENWTLEEQQYRMPSLGVGFCKTMLRQQYIEKLKVLRDIASALDYIHAHGVIFRDLKPANIGFKDNIVQLFDFGLGRELPTLDTSIPFEMSGKVGTIRYMAPEVCLHQPYNVSADVYSWSIVAYETLTLQKPYDGWSPPMHNDLVCRKGLRPDIFKCPQSVPMDIAVLIQHSWDTVPQRRPTFHNIAMQLNLFQEKQGLLLEEERLLELSRRQNFVGMNQQQHYNESQHSVSFDFFVTSPQPIKKLTRQRSHDSLETIETETLSGDEAWYGLE
jgi:serine/threonine protein kinase